jgi:hypothetical protein
MTKTQRALLVAALEALKAHDCITGYTIDGRDARPDWTAHGFDTAFHELKDTPQPFGLKKKGEAGYFLILLARRNKKVVDDWLRAKILQ